MSPQTPFSEPAVRRAFWVAMVLGCLAVLTALLNPVTGAFMAALFFLVAYGIRRGHVWAAITGSVLLLMPIVAAFASGLPSSAGAVVIAVDLAITAVLLFFMTHAAVILSRDEAARRTAWPWIALLVILTGSRLLVQPFMMSSGSMEKTLMMGDYVLFDTATWKLGRAPKPGDVVMMRYPPDPKQIYTKRIVGVPGDRLRIVNKQLYRNGALVNEPYVQHKSSFVDPFRDNFPSTPNVQLPAEGENMLRNQVRGGEVVVPPGKYFVLGDNRDDSLDSRYWGFISRSDILGSALLIYGSVDLGENHSGPKTLAIFHTRWNRLLRVL